jgi:hypothetical protein
MEGHYVSSRISTRFWAHMRLDEVRQAKALLEAYPDDAESLYERAQLMDDHELGYTFTFAGDNDHNEYLRVAAAQGHPVAMAFVAAWTEDRFMGQRVRASGDRYALAVLLDDWHQPGGGEAAVLLREAIEVDGNPYAMRDWMNWFSELDDEKTELYRRLRADCGSPNGLYNYGAELLRVGDTGQAIPYLERAVAREHVKAAQQLASIHFSHRSHIDWQRAAHYIVGLPRGNVRDQELERRSIWHKRWLDRFTDERVREMYVYGWAEAGGHLEFCGNYYQHKASLDLHEFIGRSHILYDECSRATRRASIALLKVLYRWRKCPWDVALRMAQLVWAGREHHAPEWLSEKSRVALIGPNHCECE